MRDPLFDVPEDWSVGTTLDGGISIVSVAGEVDLSTAPALVAELAAQVETCPHAVVVDLGQVSYFSSSGINALMEIQQHARSRDIPLHLVTPGAHITRTLQVAGLAENFSRHETLSDAIRVARRAGRASMRIALVSEQASPLADDLGQGTHVAQLAAALRGLGHEVVVYTRRDDPRAPDRVRTEDGYEVVHVPAGPARRLTEDEVVPHLEEFAQFLAQRWRSRPPDIAHTHHWTSGLAAAIGSRRTWIPVVHSYNAVSAQEIQQRADVERLVARKASWVVAASSPEASEMWRQGVRRIQVSMIPSGVDVEHFHPDGPVAARGALQRLVTVGKFFRGTDFADIIACLPALETVELVIAGDNPRSSTVAQELRELAHDLGVRDRVTFAGEVPRARMPVLLRSADVVVCVPTAEPYGLVALQAMACGVPVVATAVGALEDIVVHNITGLHVPPREPRVLARTLRRLLADQTLREELGIAARDRVMARYARDKLGQEVLAVYERVDRAASARPDHQGSD
ncbi:anti-sigma factor antagonist [Lentzea pudingi]|nr:anti-sigma factor antagonist [Lentzea pudingi]